MNVAIIEEILRKKYNLYIVFIVIASSKDEFFTPLLLYTKSIITYFMDVTQINWDWEDLLKVGFSLLAGVILGVEREWKDKAAGFKTIAIICLGSTLFTILSYKIGAGESEDATRIASYVVSGIGFLGAGVIFKDGINVNGLTTASIIWISAAIGMSIGFGQYLTAGIFLVACFLIILSGKWINTYWLKFIAKTIEVHIRTNDVQVKKDISQGLKAICKNYKLKQSHFYKDKAVVHYDIIINKYDLDKLDVYFLSHPDVLEFNY